jgi:hypothetical protein
MTTMPDLIRSSPKRDQTPAQPNENPRNQRQARRMKILKDERDKHGGAIRVVPNEKYRAVLFHPSTGQRFREEGGASWPNDRFTQRRLRDGSVRLEPKKDDNNKPQQGKPQEPRRSPPAPSASS